MKFLIPLFILGCHIGLWSQSYSSHFLGNTTDIITNPEGGVCLMGGASEDDQAMIWFLERASGGDVLVLRASGSDGYNSYMYTDLGVNLNSVETIVFHDAAASNDSYIHQRIEQAEAIWFAGGDQWDYISYWRDSPIDNLINQAISDRSVVVGGTSAGMAIQGGFYFSAENGTVTSSVALSNPYDNNMTVASTPFLENEYLSNVITDTHYDNPDRKGRHLAFLSRIYTDEGVSAKGIACDEFTAVCIDINGEARIFGDYPNYDDNAYFIQLNCELSDTTPENCSVGNALEWNLGGAAIKVYKVKGTSDGSNTFDLNDWETGLGGEWEHWYVGNGTLYEEPGEPLNCEVSGIEESKGEDGLILYPNPTEGPLYLSFDSFEELNFEVVNSCGKRMETGRIDGGNHQLNTGEYPSGVYIIRVWDIKENVYFQEVIQKY